MGKEKKNKDQFQPQQQYLVTKANAPANYTTEWCGLRPHSQKLLLQIEKKISEYRIGCEQLDQCNRLYDSSIPSNVFELYANSCLQELRYLSTDIDQHKSLLKGLMAAVKCMLRNTESAIHSFTVIRPHFVHQTAGSNATVPSHVPRQREASSSSSQPTIDFYSGIRSKPSPFLQQRVAKLEKDLADCCKCVKELEQLLLLDSSTQWSLVHSLPTIMSNIHESFVHVTAKMEGIHQSIQTMKKAHLANLRRQGVRRDPFLEADRREKAKQETAANTLHTTLHLPLNSQPSQHVSGLLATPTMSGVSTAQHIAETISSPHAAIGFPIFSTPSSPMPIRSLFHTTTASPTSTTYADVKPSPSSLSSSSAQLVGTMLSFPPTFGPSAGGSAFPTTIASGAATGSGAGTACRSRGPKPRRRQC